MGERLREALTRFTMICNTCQAPRPGSNFLPLLELATKDGTVTVDGEDLEALYRAGWLDARLEPGMHEITDIEGTLGIGSIEADYVWGLTPAGRVALEEGGERG